MHGGRLNVEASLDLMGETHLVGQRCKHHLLCMDEFQLKFIPVAPTVSPKVEVNTRIFGANFRIHPNLDLRFYR